MTDRICEVTAPVLGLSQNAYSFHSSLKGYHRRRKLISWRWNSHWKTNKRENPPQGVESLGKEEPTSYPPLATAGFAIALYRCHHCCDLGWAGCDDYQSFHPRSTFIQPLLRESHLERTGRCWSSAVGILSPVFLSHTFTHTAMANTPSPW